MIYFCLTERRDFGDLMSAAGLARLKLRSSPEFSSVLDHAPSSDAVIAVWSQKPDDTGQLPELLICRDGFEEDWAAWITTFGARIRPFSAYSRLVTYSTIESLNRASRTPKLDHLTWPIAGLILGEVLAASRLPDKALETLSAAACASTLSFVMFRAAAAYSDFQQWSQLVYDWESVRKVTQQRGRTIDMLSVARVCATIIEAAGLSDSTGLQLQDGKGVQIACRELINSPHRAPTSLAAISPFFSFIEEQMRGSREDRVVAFAELVRRVLATKDTDHDLTAFMLGYLASRIAPGTMRHSSVLMPVTQRYPSALLWYGFCAGFGNIEDSNLLSSRSRRFAVDLPSSARRIIRDLLRPEPIIGTPHCDIGFLELMALSRTGGDPLDGLVTTTQGTVYVELVPGASTAINTPSKITSSEGPKRPLREDEIRATLVECIDRLSEVYIELAGNDSPEREGGQRSLFQTRRKKK